MADEGQESYTRPVDGGQVVYSGIGSGQKVSITHERSTSYTQTLGSDIGFADIFSIGVSFEESMEETTTDGTSHDFTAKEGQTGDVVFTPFLRCSTGKRMLVPVPEGLVLTSPQAKLLATVKSGTARFAPDAKIRRAPSGVSTLSLLPLNETGMQPNRLREEMEINTRLA